MTYYLIGRTGGKTTPPTAPVSPRAIAMDTVNEEEESHDSFTSKSDEKTVIDCSEKADDEVFALETEPLQTQAESKDSNEATLLLSSCDG